MLGADYPALTPDYPAPSMGRQSYETEIFQREEAGADYPPPPPDYPALGADYPAPRPASLFRPGRPRVGLYP